LAHGAIRYSFEVSITLNVDDDVLAGLPLGPGERERHMQIELACRFYASGWLSFSQAARMARLDHYAFALQLADRGIPRNYSVTEALEDVEHAGRQ
jgi:predicted HTH domain antitoxin